MNANPGAATSFARSYRMYHQMMYNCTIATNCNTKTYLYL